MTARWRTMARTALSAVLFGAGFSTVVTAMLPSSASSTPLPITIKGAGAVTMFRAINPVADDMGTAANPVDFRYNTLGETEGKNAFTAAETDFLVTGVPLSSADESSVRGGLVKLPIDVASMAMIMTLPSQHFDYYALKNDPKCLPPNDPANSLDPNLFTTCISFGSNVTFNGDPDQGGSIPVPATVLANMAMAEPQSPPTFVAVSQPWYLPQPTDPAPGASPSWSDPAVLKLWQDVLNRKNAVGDPQKLIYSLVIASAAKPTWIMRSEGSAENLYLQQFVKTVDPALWDQMSAFWKRPAATLDDRVPQAVSRQGVEQQTALLGFPNSDFLGAGKGLDREGIMAAAPPSALAYLHELFPLDTNFRTVAAPNANGDYVAPTEASIKKAIDAGGEAANFAMTNKVPGAYPFVWVDYLYAPKTGLSIDKTNALAGYIRYFVTAGQDVMASLGEGRLSDGMVAEALSGANAIVSSNCVGVDRHVVPTTDAGSYVPNLPALGKVGPSLSCAVTPPPPPPTTTTLAPTTAVATTAAPATTRPTVLSVVVKPAATVSTTLAETTTSSTVVTSVVATTVKPKAKAKGAPAVTVPPPPGSLPLPVPGTGGNGLDRFATMLLGSFGFLGLRRPVGRRLMWLR